ncbi:hypothetical protein [Actinacidiphila oryziradicis]|uniref:Uncharacterized protein n=1 Tax=Actinacidiphila oryziradicis TaxID=2571141 RepID=A0A4U0RGT5_9ACTN|nr:hypothetical protein [Actinacidiphila oryziradicis]TJZ94749.1 hypothetical protein FCI23_53075 [Actinacidiphila oryziradicis]
MSAQPADTGHLARPEPTIRSVRAALPAEHRDAFQAEIEHTPLHLITKVLADWDIRARALNIPEMVAMAQRIEDERAGRAARPRVLADAEIRDIAPALRP